MGRGRHEKRGMFKLLSRREVDLIDLSKEAMLGSAV